ncbi:FAD-dependent oxidoreductase [Mucilaginibacter sp.]|jgi:thioredoxin reductase (NADPH)|uniref:FAD-dependent oxidoreductase n=1 Tax=Mucilaginibacter sp. TaxID=1882438 RepID=UPI0035653C20
MSLPIIFCIDDDPQVLRALTRDLKSRYRTDYRIVSTSIVKEGLDSLVELKNKGMTVALFLSDQRMPEMEGVAFLEKAIKIFPDAKKVLLTAYADTRAAIEAINSVQLDYYLIKPWDPPEEKLYPVLDGLIEDWHTIFKPTFSGIKVIGNQYSELSYNIKDFLAGNLVPYQWLDVRLAAEAEKLLSANKLNGDDLPVLFFEDGTYIVKPGIVEIANKVGLTPKIQFDMYDVVIIGAGPAGLAAGVYGASEGLKTLLIERRAPGGQAGTSSRIENYLGFPVGISGAELTQRGTTQATRLGTEIISPIEVTSIQNNNGYKSILLDDGRTINTRSVIITTGVNYRRLEKKGIHEFTGAGIYYGAAMTEAAACKDKDVYIVGGGNSAGQAAMYLSKYAKQVFIVVRKDDLSSTMSAYLIDQLMGTESIHLIPNSEIVEAKGSDRLESLVIVSTETRSKEERPAGALYIFIGAKPFTDWIELGISKDNKGFLETGNTVKQNENFEKIWKENRDPYLLETSCPGIFAAGDVRSGSMNRVASAVGEGSMAISFVHQYLAEVK